MHSSIDRCCLLTQLRPRRVLVHCIPSGFHASVMLDSWRHKHCRAGTGLICMIRTRTGGPPPVIMIMIPVPHVPAPPPPPPNPFMHEAGAMPAPPGGAQPPAAVLPPEGMMDAAPFPHHHHHHHHHHPHHHNDHHHHHQQHEQHPHHHHHPYHPHHVLNNDDAPAGTGAAHTWAAPAKTCCGIRRLPFSPRLPHVLVAKQWTELKHTSFQQVFELRSTCCALQACNQSDLCIHRNVEPAYSVYSRYSRTELYSQPPGWDRDAVRNVVLQTRNCLRRFSDWMRANW